MTNLQRLKISIEGIDLNANNHQLMREYNTDDMTISQFSENLQSRIDNLERNVASQIQKSVSLTASSTKIGTYSTWKITTTTVPSGLPVKFVIDGSACKCTLTNVTSNSCTLKSNSDVGVATMKAYLVDGVNVTKYVRVMIDSSVW